MTRSAEVRIDPNAFPWAGDFPNQELARLATGQAAEAFYNPLIDAELAVRTKQLEADLVRPESESRGMSKIPLGGRQFRHIAQWGDHLENMTDEQLAELHIAPEEVTKFGDFLRAAGLLPLSQSVEVQQNPVIEKPSERPPLFLAS
jgi:hypothetical protein